MRFVAALVLFVIKTALLFAFQKSCISINFKKDTYVWDLLDIVNHIRSCSTFWECLGHYKVVLLMGVLLVESTKGGRC